MLRGGSELSARVSRFSTVIPLICLILSSTYPFSLNSRLKSVSSGNTVWQAAHAMPVWRAKLGTAQLGVVDAHNHTRENARRSTARRRVTACERVIVFSIQL